MDSIEERYEGKERKKKRTKGLRGVVDDRIRENVDIEKKMRE